MTIWALPGFWQMVVWGSVFVHCGLAAEMGVATSATMTAAATGVDVVLWCPRLCMAATLPQRVNTGMIADPVCVQKGCSSTPGKAFGQRPCQLGARCDDPVQRCIQIQVGRDPDHQFQQLTHLIAVRHQLLELMHPAQ